MGAVTRGPQPGQEGGAATGPAPRAPRGRKCQFVNLPRPGPRAPGQAGGGEPGGRERTGVQTTSFLARSLAPSPTEQTDGEGGGWGRGLAAVRGAPLALNFHTLIGAALDSGPHGLTGVPQRMPGAWHRGTERGPRSTAGGQPARWSPGCSWEGMQGAWSQVCPEKGSGGPGCRQGHSWPVQGERQAQATGIEGVNESTDSFIH